MFRNAPQPKHSPFIIASLLVLVASAGVPAAEIKLLTDSLDTWGRQGDFSKGSPFGPGKYSIGDGDTLRLENGGPVPPDMTVADSFASILVATWEPSRDDATFANGFFRGKVQIHSPGTSAHLLMRGNDMTHSNYHFSANTATGRFSIRANNTLVDPVEYAILAESDPAGPLLEVDEPWWFEGGIVGNQLSFKFWEDGTAEPSEPQLVVTDDQLGPMTGTLLCTVMWIEGATSPVIGSASFSNLSFTSIPEPSSVVLAALALVGAGAIGGGRR